MYSNVSKSTQTGTEPGYKSKVFFARADDFDAIARPVDPPVAAGDKYKIAVAHTFKVGKAAWQLDCKLYSPVGTMETQGDPGEQQPLHQLVFEIIGDNEKTLETFMDMLNDDLVFFVPDADCLTNDSFVQFGDDCKPCDVKVAFTSKKANETGKKLYTVTISSPKKFFYKAALDITP
jgi:hypothetical protein